MSIVKSFSFPDGDIRGDMFYIKHNSSNFTVIDCFLKGGNDKSCRKDELIKEVVRESGGGRIRRFISTHPDNDHILGIEELDKKWPIRNFYAVENNVPADRGDASLTKYIELKDNKNFPIKKGITRCWLNQKDDNNGGSGIRFLWPDVSNEKYQKALKAVEDGKGNKNDICCVMTYSVEKGARYMWMGDMETGMQQEFYDCCKKGIPCIDILFQPHHGRESGAVPPELLKALSPKLIIIGNAPTEHIDYGNPDRTITQNTAGDILFENEIGKVHVYTKNKVSNVPSCLKKFLGKQKLEWYYCGTLSVRNNSEIWNS